MYTTCSELVVFLYWAGKSMNNLLSYCGLVDSRISASDKDLPVNEWSKNSGKEKTHIHDNGVDDITEKKLLNQ